MGLRWGEDLVFIYNDAYRSILMDRHPKAFGQPTREVYPEIYDELGTLLLSILRGERGTYSTDNQKWMIRRHGLKAVEATFAVSFSPVRDPAAPGGIGGVLVAAFEITERVHNEEQLRRLTEGLEAEVEQRTRERDRIWQVSEDLLAVSTFEGYYISMNPAWTHLLGWTQDEIRSMHVDQLRHPDDAPEAHAARRKLAAGVSTVRVENRFRHKDGSWRWIAWTMTVDGGLIYVVGRDVTAEREAAEALRNNERRRAQLQKMEALGQLTGGVAHDFNNLLMVVSGNVRRLKNLIDDDARALRAADAIDIAAQRGESLTRQLLTFSRRQAFNPIVLSVGESIETIRPVLASTVGTSAKLETVVPPHHWPVKVDASELELLLVNLVLNARDALPQGGTITIAVENACLDSGTAPQGLSGDFVALSVSDTGTGIPEDVLPKVFDPFFTTKGVDKGTGLGLSQVHGFAHQSGGTVTVDSRLGEGTTVTVYLPRAREALRQAPASTEEQWTAGGTVLLVEDHPDVADVSRDMLRQLGFEVRFASSADEALTAFEADRSDIVVSDIVMSGSMNGLDLAREIRKRDPGVPILLVTGYAESAGHAADEFKVLRKPFQIADLARATHELLVRAGDEQAG